MVEATARRWPGSTIRKTAAYHFSHFADGKCVLIFMAEGPRGIAEATAEAIERSSRATECGQVDTGSSRTGSTT